MLEFLQISTILLLHMTEDTQEGIKFHQKVVKINSMAITWDVFIVCDKELLLDAIKHPKGFRFLNCS